MVKNSENKINNFLSDLRDCFGTVVLMQNYTLSDHDYFDTAGLYPDNNNSSEDRILSYYDKENRNIVAQQIRDKKIQEKKYSWDVVGFDYLERYSSGFYHLTPNEFQFYYLAWINCFLMSLLSEVDFKSDEKLISDKFFSMIWEGRVTESMDAVTLNFLFLVFEFGEKSTYHYMVSEHIEEVTNRGGQKWVEEYLKIREEIEIKKFIEGYE